MARSACWTVSGPRSPVRIRTACSTSRTKIFPSPTSPSSLVLAANAAQDRLRDRYEIGIISNVDDKLLGISRRHLRTELDLVVTAQQVRSYKPDPTHLRECARRIGGKKGWVHIASGYESDIGPALKLNVPVIWVNRHGEKLDGRKPPTATVKNLREAAKKLEEELVQDWIAEGDELRGAYRYLAAIDAYRQAQRIHPTTAAQEKLASAIHVNSRIDKGWFQAAEEIQKQILEAVPPCEFKTVPSMMDVGLGAEGQWNGDGAQ